ncbi:single-stranded DNA-binding protein [Candidatus Cyanaurora vandensis]|uniref:single-stranded DNA-binding protein n=1 Tax=Candidatus Cyanaurora vandensis TaxID=2714958 RepID=UPI00257A4ABD|nr:single-stranded DNA-binding protein [Candidatus Cyanaurora vandensis]
MNAINTEKRRYAMLNKVMVIGRLIKDCEVRFLDSTKGESPLQLTTFVLALDGAANYGQEPGFLEFSHLGEFPVAEHLLKGRLIYVEGHITQQRKEVEGQRRTYTNFTCDRLQLLSAKPTGDTVTEEVGEEEEFGLPVAPAPKTQTPNALLAQTLVNHYGPMAEWSGKQVGALIRWLKDKSGVAADQVTLEGFCAQLERLPAERAQDIMDDLNRAFAHKSA